MRGWYVLAAVAVTAAGAVLAVRELMAAVRESEELLDRLIADFDDEDEAGTVPARD